MPLPRTPDTSQREDSACAADLTPQDASSALLANLVRASRAEIVADWEAAVRTLPQPRPGQPVLATALSRVLDEIADLAACGRLEPSDSAVAAIPLVERLDLAHAVAEYAALRAAIARALERRAGASTVLDAMRVADRVIDASLMRLAEHFVHALRDEAAATAERMRFLAEATAMLASSLNYDETLQRVAQLAVPILADWCVVDLVDPETGQLRRVSVAHRDPALNELARGWAQRYPTDWVASRGVANVIRTGKPELVSKIEDRALVEAARDEHDLEALRALGLESFLIVPLVARERRLGALTLVSASSRRRFDASDVELALELARRAALAVDNARSYFEAQQAIRAREQILAIVSHDLRNPLSAVGVIVSLLRDSQHDPEAVKQLGVVLDAVEQMKRLINDMLDTSVIQSGRLVLERQLVDPRQLVAQAIERHRAQASAKRITLDYAISTDAQIEGDPLRIAQVLDNLLGNALKFCSAGDAVRVELASDGADTRWTVADSGPGIAADELPHIFEPYWVGARNRHRGSGLGLFICKGIVEAHGGRIWAESAPQRGTRIVFTLPAAARP